MNAVDDRLQKLGILLPVPAPPLANYVPFRLSGHLLFISGQLAVGPGGQIAARHRGKVGQDIFNEAAQEAARLCAINVLAQAKAALGDLDRISACLRLGGFINSAPDFVSLPAVMNGASDLIVQVLGEEAGRHARMTVGVAQLPMESCAEVEALFEVR